MTSDNPLSAMALFGMREWVAVVTGVGTGLEPSK